MISKEEISKIFGFSIQSYKGNEKRRSSASTKQIVILVS